jgi:hypothetical protein
MANATFNRGLAYLADYDWASDAVDVGVMLVESAYSFARTHNTIADVVAQEATGTGYVRKAVASGTRTTNEDDAGSAANLRITNGTVSWSSINAGTNLEVILFFVTGTGLSDNTNYLLGHVDTGTNIPINTNGGDVTLNFSTDGAVKYA